MSLKYRSDIQSLRGIAVIFVLLYHGFPATFKYGYLGVDSFFVISGFVIAPLVTRIFQQAKANPDIGFARLLKDFYASRFYRLAPALFVAILVSLTLILVFGPIDQIKKSSIQSVLTVILLGNYSAFRYGGNYFYSDAPFVHMWSLAVEQQIYLVIPILIFMLIGGRMINFTTRRVLFILSVITIISFVTNIFDYKNIFFSENLVDKIQIWNFYAPYSRAWQFTIGFLGYFASSQSTRKIEFKKSVQFFISALVLIVLFIFLCDSQIVNSSIVTLTTLTLIVTKSLYVLPNSFGKFSTWIGNRSYSIYLYHMPLVFLAKNSPFVYNLIDFKEIFIVLSLLITMLLASVSYTKVENRFRRNTSLIENTLKVKVIPFLFSSVFLLSFFVYMFSAKSFSSQTIIPFAGEANKNCTEGKMLGNKLCLIPSNNSKKTVMLFGDSFAGSISSAVIDASKKSELDLVYTYNYGCQFFLSDQNSNFTKSVCRSTYFNVVTYIESNKPDSVIISYDWNSSLLSSIKTQQSVLDSLLEVRKLVPKMLLVVNIPSFPDENSFMRQRTIFHGNHYPQKVFSELEISKQRSQFSVLLENWAKLYRIEIMNVADFICADNFCTRFEDSNWLYSDYKHLSIYGASKTIPYFENYFLNLK